MDYTTKLNRLKRELNAKRDEVVSANATIAEIDSHLEQYKKELAELGIKDPSKAGEEIEKMQEKVESVIDKISEKLGEWE